MFISRLMYFVRGWRFVALAGSCLLTFLPAIAISATIETVAGGGSDNGLAATAIALYRPAGMSTDAAGNVYIVEYFGNRVRKIAAGTGIATTVVGGGTTGLGDGGPATQASLNWPRGVAVDSAGNLYITDTGYSRIRKVDAATGIITTIAGTGSSGYDGDGPDARTLRISGPTGIAVDSGGTVYFTDANNHRVRKITPAGALVTIAGTGTVGYSGDGGNALSADLHTPTDLALDGTGNLFVADYFNNRIRRIDTGGTITTVAGDGVGGYSGDGGSALAAHVSGTTGLATDTAGNLYFGAFYNARVRKVDMASGIITTVVGTGAPGYAGDGGAATAALINQVYGVTVDGAGNLYVADVGNMRVRRVDAGTGTISTFAGNGQTVYTGDGGNALDAVFDNPRELALDAAGNLFVLDTWNQRLRRVDAATKTVSTIAGTGLAGSAGDGGPATNATFQFPEGLARDATGNLYLGDSGNHRIRKIANDTGLVATIAGNTSGFGGDNGPAVDALLSSPSRVAVAANGDLYFADGGNHRVRMISASSGTITTVAGNGTAAFGGDGGPASAASINYPSSLALDAVGNLYIGDYLNRRIRKVDALSHIISTVAGDGNYGYTGDGGPATSAQFREIFDIAVDPAGNLYLADCGNHRIRRVAAGSGIVSTIAGTGTAGSSGDGGPATGAEVNCPYGLALNATGTLLYFADTNANVIRRFPTGDFGDVPFNHWAANYIHGIAAAGITTGCGDLNYCPANNVTREQMAAFIVRAREGDPVAGYCGSTAPFGDVSTASIFCGHIKRLQELGITTGCGNGNYCPTQNVTREQMAAFIIRAKEGNPVAGYCGSTSPFNDVPVSNGFCGHIKRMLELNITTGCGGGNYCPTQSVTRDQMAAFLGRAFLGM